MMNIERDKWYVLRNGEHLAYDREHIARGEAGAHATRIAAEFAEVIKD